MIVNNVLYSTEEPEKVDDKGLGHELHACMVKYSDHVAQIDARTGKTETFGELLSRCVETVGGLKNLGVKPGDHIALCTHNHMDTCVPILAGLFAGAVVVPLNVALPEDKLISLLNDFAPVVVFVSREYEETFVKMLNCTDAETNLIILDGEESFGEFLRPVDDFKVYETADLKRNVITFRTGGTTGGDKQVCLNHYSIMQSYRNLRCAYDVDSVTLNYGPMFWMTGPFNIFSCIYNGSSRLISKDFHLAEMWKLINKHKVNCLFIPYMVIVAIIKDGVPKTAEISSLKRINFGGGHTPRDLKLKLLEMFPGVTFSNGYGLTEAGGAVSLLEFSGEDRNSDKLGSVGTLVAGTSAKVADVGTNKSVGPRQSGELRVKSDHQMNGYFGLDSAGCWDADGFLKTEDICYYDEDGYIYFVDRLKYIVRYRQSTISPTYVEETLIRHPGIYLSAVVGVPGRDVGEIPVGVVVLKEKFGFTAEDLERYLGGCIDDERYKCVRIVIVGLETIPFTATGKIKRQELIEKIQNMYVF